MPEGCEELRRNVFSAKLFKKIRLIKEGEIPKLFRNETAEEPKVQIANVIKIPQEQIAAFEKTKLEEEDFKIKQQTGDRSIKKSTDKRVKLTGIDEILAIRQELKSSKPTEKPLEEKLRRKKPVKSATEKIREGTMKAWVDRCYDVVHKINTGHRDPDVRARDNPDIRELLEWDRLPLGLDNVAVRNEVPESESGGSIDKDPSSVEDKRTSSDETEKILRTKAGAPQPRKKEEDKREFESQSEVETQTKSGVNFVLSNYFVRNLQELKTLAFNEELYAFHPDLGIVGSWSVDVKICETDHKRVNVQFEGLLIDRDTHYGMYTAGVVDRRFNPVTEFRVEQVTRPDMTRSRTLFFHKKKKKWLFDLREGINDSETRKTLSLNYNQMLRVVSEGANILLIRKIVMYCNPIRIEERTGDTGEQWTQGFCPCYSLSQACTCKMEDTPFSLKTRFRLKMRSLCIGGDICRTNYRFFKPVRVVYNGVELEVVRVRRRIEMPGNLIQTTNYYMTTAGQLMAVTFNDPYPYDTPFWLQVDPKAVLNRHRVVPPERIVPLRERYMCDPVLKQYYENEVQRLMVVNKTYLRDHPALFNSLKSIFQDLLNDKPHRVVAFIQDFFFEGYRLNESDRDIILPSDEFQEDESKPSTAPKVMPFGCVIS